MKLYLKKWLNKNPPKTIIQDIIYFIYLDSFPKDCYLPGKMVILYLQCLQMSFYLYNTNVHFELVRTLQKYLIIYFLNTKAKQFIEQFNRNM